MKIRTRQINIQEIKNQTFDFIIACSGYETRSKYLFSNHNINSKFRYCLCFSSHKNVLSREENDLFFIKKNEFTPIEGAGTSSNEIKQLLKHLDEFLTTNDSISILIDYSSMARVWYSTLLLFFSSKYFNSKKIQLIFSYSESEFTSPIQQESYNCEIEPIQGYYSISIPHKPTALIISLGYIERQAYGLAEYFDAIPYLYINQNSADDPIYLKVIETNKPLIQSVRENHIFHYTLSNLAYAESLLFQLCNELRHKHRVVIAPCGPKPFTLLSLIVAIRMKNVDVWRISAKSNLELIDKKPSGKLCILEYYQQP